jgi:hypothetical protein
MDVEVDSLDVVEASEGSVKVLLWSLASLAIVYVVVMQFLYGTLSLSKAARTWKRGGGDEEVNGSNDMMMMMMMLKKGTGLMWT